VPDARLGERVCLAMVASIGCPIDPEALLRDLASAGLATYDLPEFVLPLSEMPLTASGKIVKRELVRWVAEGRVRPIPVRDLRT
jgi:acyl-CoA synthetase